MIYLILAIVLIITCTIGTIIALIRLNTLSEEIKKIEEGLTYEDE